MTERSRPIIMQPHNVRAILDGRKTQTRRIVKPQPKHRLIEGLGHVTHGMNPADDGAVWYDADCVKPGREVRCPYGRVGDDLWVREKWWQAFKPTETSNGCVYYADYEPPTRLDPQVRFNRMWRNPLYMPRVASRLTLRITDVRVQRVQEISAADAIDEGVNPTGTDPCDIADSAKDMYRESWNHINGKGSWESNPWVWAITFKVEEKKNG